MMTLRNKTAFRIVSHLAIALCFVSGSTIVEAQRRGGGGGGVQRSGGAAQVNRDVTRTSVRSTSDVNRNANVNRNADVNRNVDVNRSADVNRNVDANRNLDVDRDVNVNRNIDGDYDRWGHPVARGVGAALAVGTAVALLPSGCSTVVVSGITYSQCGSTWYQPYYQGSNVEYVVVNSPN